MHVVKLIDGSAPCRHVLMDCDWPLLLSDKLLITPAMYAVDRLITSTRSLIEPRYGGLADES
jgi:hypothetical protein